MVILAGSLFVASIVGTLVLIARKSKAKQAGTSAARGAGKKIGKTQSK